MALSLTTLTRIDRSAKRVAEIAGVLAKYGLADWLANVDYDWLQDRLKSAGGERLGHLTTDRRIRLALTELGTSYVKLGQMLSTRPDLIGADLADELSKLQAGTPPDPFADVDRVVREELGAPISELFAGFEQDALASASIGQVHAARLASGEEVVVKVMHAGIEDRVARDLDIMLGLAELMEKHAPALRQYQPVATARDFRRTLLREMDFAYEQRHLVEFARNFDEDPTVHFPRTIPNLSSRRVLTMERLRGISMSDREALENSGADLNEFARRGANMYLEMIFRDGFYHADPHPGNLMLLAGGVVGVLDCGMVGRIDEQLRDDVEAMLLAAVQPDPGELVEIVCRVGAVPPELDRDDLRAELADLLADYTGQSIDQFDLGGALMRVIDLIRGYHIVLPSGFAMLLKTLVMLEGSASQVSPTFSLAELLKPYYRKAVQRRLAPKRLAQELMRTYRDWRRLFDALPRDLSDIVARVRKGSFEVHLEHRRLESTVDRLVRGILTAAFFMGSSMMLSSKVPPLVYGISLIGALGCAASLVEGYRLVSAIRKDEKARKRRM